MPDDTPWLSDEEQRIWRAFLWASRRVHESLDHQLQRDSQIPHAYYVILATLSEAPQQQYNMSDLSRMTRFSPSRLSHAMTKLENRGWVTRQPHGDSGRTVVATLTTEGVDAIAGAAPGHVNQVRDILFDRLDWQEQQQLKKICCKILSAINEDTNGAKG